MPLHVARRARQSAPLPIIYPPTPEATRRRRRAHDALGHCPPPHSAWSASTTSARLEHLAAHRGPVAALMASAQVGLGEGGLDGDDGGWRWGTRLGEGVEHHPDNGDGRADAAGGGERILEVEDGDDDNGDALDRVSDSVGDGVDRGEGQEGAFIVLRRPRGGA